MMRAPIEPSVPPPTMRSLLWALTIMTSVLVLASPRASAQSAPPGPAAPVSSPKPEDLEPGVNTSSPADPSSESAPSAPQAAPPGRAAGRSTRAAQPAVPPASEPKPVSAQVPAEEKLTTRATAAAPAGTAKGSAGSGKAQDRIQLDTTQITGNRELPKVLYIVPWKRSDLGDVVGKPVNSLLDEVLTPVDRDVFKRENRYYDALKAESAAAPPGVAAGPDRH